MSLQPADKKALTILAAVGAVMVIVIAVATALLVRAMPETDPKISVAAGTEYQQVSPSYWCTLQMDACRPAYLSLEQLAALPVTVFPVPIDESLVLSVPSEIATKPWTLTALYATSRGIQPVTWIKTTGDAYTEILPSTQHRVLLGIEVKPFSAVVEDAPDGLESGQGTIPFRGHYAVDTRPKGFSVTNETVLGEIRGTA
ncbi:DUF2771 domain-containing protein [Gordonia alkaliphila]|uniref:DUF2771 domain-containing protein n=1 Tax=Gordonia alkaliphila TaxID=1053547 RepID=A0ABP8YUV9_9ACTN|nr:DUF2771 family protein [Gordonia alkaliphila]MCK0439627.1 DUF2771 domain-containing protein [Gordonia alkaliphila]